MYLYLITQPTELVVDMELFWPRLLTWALELNKKWVTTWQPEDPVRIAVVTSDLQLGALDS
jgi:hypothetical protein